MGKDSALTAREARWHRRLAAVDRLGDELGAGSAFAVVTIGLRMPWVLRMEPASAKAALIAQEDFASFLGRSSLRLLSREFRMTGDGPESLLAVGAGGREVKAQSMRFESEYPRGAVLDVDVMDSSHAPMSRRDEGLPGRSCLVCGGDATACSAGSRHSAGEVEEKVRLILSGEPEPSGGLPDIIGSVALRATLDEVSLSPKPGLVGPESCGAHRDMDYWTFLDSAAALSPWFRTFALIGAEEADRSPETVLPRLRASGIEAERSMFDATGGVNTHKGLIFSLGLLCAAAGSIAARGGVLLPAAVARQAAAIAHGITARDLGAFGVRDAGSVRGPARTAGERLYLEKGVMGIRGEVEAGYPSIMGVALPVMRRRLADGASLDTAAKDALLTLYETVEDTNVLSRAGAEGLSLVRREAHECLRLGGSGTPEGLSRMRLSDATLTARGISPGGCADLLAAALFLMRLEKLPQLKSIL